MAESKKAGPWLEKKEDKDEIISLCLDHKPGKLLITSNKLPLIQVRSVNTSPEKFMDQEQNIDISSMNRNGNFYILRATTAKLFGIYLYAFLGYQIKSSERVGDVNKETIAVFNCGIVVENKFFSHGHVTEQLPEFKITQKTCHGFLGNFSNGHFFFSFISENKIHEAIYDPNSNKMVKLLKPTETAQAIASMTVGVFNGKESVLVLSIINFGTLLSEIILTQYIRASEGKESSLEYFRELKIDIPPPLGTFMLEGLDSRTFILLSHQGNFLLIFTRDIEDVGKYAVYRIISREDSKLRRSKCLLEENVGQISDMIIINKNELGVYSGRPPTGVYYQFKFGTIPADAEKFDMPIKPITTHPDTPSAPMGASGESAASVSVLTEPDTQATKEKTPAGASKF